MQPTATVLVYSDNANTREQVRLAAGRRPAADAPQIEILECATHPAVLEALEQGGIDVCVLDGETAPLGGWASAGRSRTRFSAARRCCCSSAARRTPGWPPGAARTPL